MLKGDNEMAWYYGTYSCGHEGRENIVGPTKNRQWIADRKFENLCEECYQAKLMADREAKNAEALEKSKEFELPELIGTEKQVAWANAIRLELAEYFQNWAETLIFNEQGKTDYRKVLQYMVEHKTKASWYIDNRGQDKELLKVELLEEIPSEEEIAEREIEKDIRIESAVFPENCEYRTPAEIIVKDDEVSVKFERSDKFRELVKELGYKWEGIWNKKIGFRTGTAVERASELGNKLLNAGFPISILDADTRRKAIEADYEPECDRWITTVVNGEYKGWLAIEWQGRDDDLYHKAKRLPMSLYRKPCVIVKAEYWQEVEEFADILGFKLSPGTHERISEVKTMQESAKVVVPVEPKEVEKEDKLAEILKSSSEILEDLKEGD